MKMSNLDDTFNVEVSETPEGGCATRKDQLTNVTPGGLTNPIDLLKMILKKIMNTREVIFIVL